ncbi:MAG TPA: Ig-like domain-containing protein, partial [Sphingomicrobium sp.]|nr:Ig-like domain-containing protein [Sphingomicrobium sp.]
MRYEDASGAFQASGPIANDDADTLSAGQRGPATGNLITGEGTQHGSAGADNAAGAQVSAIAGKGGEDSSFSGGKLSVTGEHGQLTVDADGNYSYLANGNVENVRDRFTYTLADKQGNSDTASLIVEIGKTPAVIKADAQQIVPGPDGVVTLPPGVELSDVRVVGRNLVVDLPDGTQLIILDGAIFVPQLVLGGVEVPATNVAALLIGQEVQPAAGEIPPSGGGSFALPPPPLDPGIPLGDLIPPTEYNYVPPEPEEVLDIIDRDPEITIQPDGQPASVNAVDSVDERGLPSRNGGEPEGSGEEAAAGANGDPSEATAGTILIDAPDGVGGVTINGVLVTGAVGQEIDGAFGTLTITGFDGDNILYSYVLNDNTSGNDTQDDFEVVLTDDDGDTATATLTIDIIDDVPTARPDTDSIAAGQFGPVTGNVITDASAGDAGDSDSGRDTVGADNASITAVSSANVPANSDNGAPFVVNGQYGVLTLQSDGSYSYVRNPGTPGGVNDVFNYTLTDGDGDTSTTTLTISIADTPPTIDVPVAGEDGTQVNERGLPTRNGEPAGSGESADGNGADNDDSSETTLGTVNFTPGDGPATIRIDGVAVTSVGQTFNGDHGVLTITAIGANSVSYSYTLTDNTSGNATSDSFAFSVTDQDGDVASGNLVIGIVDDVPTAVNDTDLVPAGTFGPATGNVITDAAAGDAGDGDNGADTVGADNATVSGLASNNVPANVDNDAAGGFTVNGQYGVLTMQADGSYSYVRNPGTPGGVNDVFTYTITDGDGDAATATLTISIADSPVTLDAPDQGEAGTVVSEVGLPTRNGGEPAGSGESADGNGADNDDASETTAGAITYTAPDGPATITIDGVAVTTVGQTFAGSFGTLTVTSIAGGSIGYSYTLADNTSGNATSDDFAISVTDADGDVANDTLVINIIDDVPTAVNDTDTVPGGQATATGNVITDASAGDAGDGDTGADTVGADNATVSGVSSNNVPANSDNNPAGGFVVVGQYGTLTMQADGSYSYVRADGAPGNFQDVFTYTLTDGDGDSDTATLTIDISDAAPNLPDPAAVLLDDDALAGGNAGGTGDDVDSQGTPGQLAGSGGDGDLDYGFTGLDTLPAGFSVNTVNAGQIQILQGATVVLTVTLDNETGAYTVVQNNPISHPAGSNENNISFSIGVQVVDADGDAEGASISINVDDDTPVAANDTDSITSGGNTATGNVITDASAGDAGDTDTGADSVGADGGAAIVGLASNNVPANVDNNPVGGFVVVGQYGTLTMQADGSYSYLRAGGS